MGETACPQRPMFPAHAIESLRLTEIVYAYRLIGSRRAASSVITEKSVVALGWRIFDADELDKANARRRKRHRALKAAGICTDCRKAPAVDASRCAACRAAALERNRASYARNHAAQLERIRAVREARKAAGRCPCGQPAAPGRRMCRPCQDRHNAKARARRAEKRAQSRPDEIEAVRQASIGQASRMAYSRAPV